VGALVTSPLEVVKTRLQAKRNNVSLRTGFMFGLGMLRSLRTFWQQEGFFGLYRGLGSHCVGAVPSRALHFLVYGNTKIWLENNYPSNWVATFASAAAGGTVVTVTQPIWYVKTLLQLQTTQARETLYSGPLDVVRKTIATEGYRGLYKGLSASYFGLSETMIQFTLYERLKCWIIANKQLHNTKIENSSNQQVESITALETFGLSGVSKLAASAITYPHEVVRTRLREQKGDMKVYKNIIHGLYVIGREEGRIGLYSGMGFHLLRVVPNAAITLFIYEAMLSLGSKSAEIEVPPTFVPEE